MHCCNIWVLSAVKVKPTHTTGVDHVNVQQITPDVVSKMESSLEPPKVELSNVDTDTPRSNK